MRIVLRDQSRRLIGRIDVNESLRPTRVPVALAPTPDSQQPTAAPREVFLNWETALDDAGQLRRCVACGCTDLFTEKAFPMVTGAVVVLAFIGAAMGALGLAQAPPVLIGMAVVLVLDVAILFFSRRRLICYQCRSTYLHLPIAPYHKPWDRATADQHPAIDAEQPVATPPAEEPTAELILPTVVRTAPAPAGGAPGGVDNKDYFA